MTVDVMGIPVQNVDMREAVADVSAFLDTREGKMVVTPNAEILQLCLENEAVKRTIRSADYIVPDGIGVVRAASMLGTPLKAKVAGCDLAWNLLREIERKGKRLFLLGAKSGVAEKAAENMKKAYPQLRICGVMDGYFQDEAQAADAVRKADADALYVCLGVPRQEQWMEKYRDTLHVGVMMGLGGSFDVYAGQVKRAPKIFINLGLEWLYRLIKEPWRIKRMMKLPRFFWNVRKYKKRRKDYAG